MRKRGKNQSQRPSRLAIVKANEDLLRVRGLLGDGDDGKPAAMRTCWACGYEDGSVICRAHVVPRRLGGSDDPRNFWLLCTVCHDEQPDDGLYEVQLYWLKNRESSVDRALRQARPFLADIEAGNITVERARELMLGKLPSSWIVDDWPTQ